ncbi:hypothetical protein [Cohnella sp. 56]|uniref:hypothetical protein n=1 Tax=Cohnella sp. 56 TaxID=3113722 RepID=UPI0030E7FE9D
MSEDAPPVLFELPHAASTDTIIVATANHPSFFVIILLNPPFKSFMMEEETGFLDLKVTYLFRESNKIFARDWAAGLERVIINISMNMQGN